MSALLIPFLSQEASEVGESSIDFHKEATAPVHYPVETAVFAHLVVASTLLSPRGKVFNGLPYGYVYIPIWLYAHIGIAAHDSYTGCVVS